LLIFAILLCSYGAYLGFEALGRSAVLSAVVVIPALVFIMATLVKKVDLLNLTPVFYNGVTPVIKTAVDSVGQTVEYAIIAVCLPKVTGNVKKGFFWWLSLQTLLMAIMFFFATTVMGNFTGTQLFPFHTLASLAEFAMFDRLDAIFTSVWILCAFIKAGLLIYLQSDILHRAFEKIERKNFIIGIGAITIVTNLFVASEFKRFSFVDNSIFKIIITGITAFVIPLILLFLKRKGREKCENQS
jgi:spore germination protein KB